MKRTVLAALLFGLAYYWGNRYQPVEYWQSTDPVPILTPDLWDEYNRPVYRTDWLHHWSFVMLGSVQTCRTQIEYFVWVWNYLAAQPDLQKKMRLVIVDPAEPDPVKRQSIDRYLHAFSVLYGDQKSVHRFSQQLKLKSCAKPALIDPAGRLIGWIDLSSPQQSAEILSRHAAELRP